MRERFACYTKVELYRVKHTVSLLSRNIFLNRHLPLSCVIPLCEQYPNVQKESPKTWRAFLRRIKAVYNFDVSKTEPIPRQYWGLKELPKAKAEQLNF